MDEQQFKAHYIATFCASWSAVTYSDHCLRGWDGVRQPIEDAIELANEAWELYAAAKADSD